MVEQRTLTPSVVVRIHVPQLIFSRSFLSGFFLQISVLGIFVKGAVCNNG